MIQRYLIPLLIVILSSSVYILYVDATYKDIGRLIGNADVLKGYIVDADNARTKLDAIAEEYNSFPPVGVSRLDVLLPEKIDNVRFIIDLNEVAMRHGVQVLSPEVKMSQSSGPESSSLSFVPSEIKFKVVSTYNVFYEFLVDLERSLALRDVGSIKLKSIGEKSQVSNIMKPEQMIYEYEVAIQSYSLH